MTSWLDAVNIRLMTEEDLTDIEWEGEYRRYRKVYREVYRGLLAGRSFPWIAERNDVGVIGQVFLTEKQPHKDYSNHPYMFLSSFRVKPAYRQKGLGTFLLKVCEGTAAEKNIQVIFLNCAKSNHRSREFYERNGFAVLRSDPGKWSYVDDTGKVREETEPAWVMRKVLPGAENA